MHARSVAQSCQTPCDPMGWTPPDSSVHGIFQARILEWVAVSFSRRSSRPKDWTWIFYVSCRYVAGRFFTTSTTWKAPCIIYPCGFSLFKIFGGMWTIFSLCNIASALCFEFLATRHVGLAPWSGIAPAPPELEGEATTTKSPGKPLSVAYFIYNSLYRLIPYFWTPLPLPSPQITTSLFYLWASFFVIFASLLYFLGSTY